MLTEQPNERTANIDTLDTLEIVRAINDEDRTVAEAVRRALPQIAQAVEVIVAGFRRGGRLFYVGSGTSGRLGVLDAVECVPTFSTPPEMVQGVIAGGERAFIRAVEGAEDRRDAARADLQARHLTGADVVVGIAASGRTPYVLGALEYAHEVGAPTIGVACNDPSPLLELAQVRIGVPVGAEVIAGSTRMKAGTAQKMVLNMLSTASMIRLGKVYGNLMVDLQITNEKLADRARRIVMQVSGADGTTAERLLAQADGEAKTAIVMHRLGIDAASARERLAQAGGSLRAVIG